MEAVILSMEKLSPLTDVTREFDRSGFLKRTVRGRD